MIVVGVCSWDIRAERWLRTLRKSGYGDKIALCITDSPSTDLCKFLHGKYDVDIMPYNFDKNFWSKNSGMYCPQWKCIKDVSDKYRKDMVLRTDVWDVIWQDDPRKYIEECGDIYISPEFVPIKNILNLDGNLKWLSHGSKASSLPKNWKERDIINSGFVCAKGRIISFMASSIFERRYDTYIDQSEYMRWLWDSRFRHRIDNRLVITLSENNLWEKKDNEFYLKSGGEKIACIHALNDGRHCKGWSDVTV